MSLFLDIESSFKTFFLQLTSTIGFTGLLALALGVELFLVIIFAVRASFSYEVRLKRSLDKINAWLFKNKTLSQDNVKEFNDLVKRGPKRLSYYWQQYILFRDGEPTQYLSLENLVEKPLKTSGIENSLKTLSALTTFWSFFVLLLGLSYQGNSMSTLTVSGLVGAVILPVLVFLIGVVAIIILRSRKTSNLDDIYHIYHIFARFILNACVDLPPFIDYDLLFTPKEIERGNPQLREYYESRARKAKEEFENAQKNDVDYVEYDFEEAGVDGSLVLERAMKETEAFINKKTNTLSKIANVDAQKEALRRNYENVQKDLQRKIQASKENINKLIQQQEATTNRMEVSFLRKQQEQEISKQESLQAEYDQEETRFAVSSEELKQERDALNKDLDEAKENVQKAMLAEYKTFYQKILTQAHEQAENSVNSQTSALKQDRDSTERELALVQTQVKRLVDENDTLRERLAALGDNASKEIIHKSRGRKNRHEQAQQSAQEEQSVETYVESHQAEQSGVASDFAASQDGALVGETYTGEPYTIDDDSLQTENFVEQSSSDIQNDAQPSNQQSVNAEQTASSYEEQTASADEGRYDEDGNYVYPDGSYYDPNGLFHDAQGNIYDMNGNLIGESESAEPIQSETASQPVEEQKLEQGSEELSVGSGAIVATNNTTEPKKTEEVVKSTEGTHAKELAKSEENAQEVVTDEPPKKKRGRPRKEVTDQPKKTPGKRGRPRKVVEESALSEKKTSTKTKTTRSASTKSTTGSKSKSTKATSASSKSKKEPTKKTSSKSASSKTATEKTSTKKPASKKTTTAKATAKKTSTKSASTKSTSAKKKTAAKSQSKTTAKKEVGSMSLSRINKLITEEEERLSKMKALINSEISDAMSKKEKAELADERAQLLKAIEDLQASAENADAKGKSKDLESINKRLEDLISEISTLNKKA